MLVNTDISKVEQHTELSSISSNVETIKLSDNTDHLKSTKPVTGFGTTSRKKRFSPVDYALLNAVQDQLVCCMFAHHGWLPLEHRDSYDLQGKCSTDSLMQTLDSMEEFAHHIDIGESYAQPTIDLSKFKCGSTSSHDQSFTALPNNPFADRKVSLLDVLIWQYGFIERENSSLIRSHVASIIGASIQNNPYSRTYLLQESSLSSLVQSQTAFSVSRSYLDVILWIVCYGEPVDDVKAAWIFTLRGFLDEQTYSNNVQKSFLESWSNMELQNIGSILRVNNSNFKYPNTSQPLSTLLETSLNSGSVPSFKRALGFVSNILSMPGGDENYLLLRKSCQEWIKQNNFVSKLESVLTMICGKDILSYDSTCLVVLETYIVILESLQNSGFTQDQCDKKLYFLASLLKPVAGYNEPSRRMLSYLPITPLKAQCSLSERDWLYDNAKELAEEWTTRIKNVMKLIHK